MYFRRLLYVTICGFLLKLSGAENEINFKIERCPAGQSYCINSINSRSGANSVNETVTLLEGQPVYIQVFYNRTSELYVDSIKVYNITPNNRKTINAAVEDNDVDKYSVKINDFESVNTLAIQFFIRNKETKSFIKIIKVHIRPFENRLPRLNIENNRPPIPIPIKRAKVSFIEFDGFGCVSFKSGIPLELYCDYTYNNNTRTSWSNDKLSTFNGSCTMPKFCRATVMLNEDDDLSYIDCLGTQMKLEGTVTVRLFFISAKRISYVTDFSPIDGEQCEKHVKYFYTSRRSSVEPKEHTDTNAQTIIPTTQPRGSGLPELYTDGETKINIHTPDDHINGLDGIGCLVYSDSEKRYFNCKSTINDNTGLSMNITTQKKVWDVKDFKCGSEFCANHIHLNPDYDESFITCTEEMEKSKQSTVRLYLIHYKNAFLKINRSMNAGRTTYLAEAQLEKQQCLVFVKYLNTKSRNTFLYNKTITSTPINVPKPTQSFTTYRSNSETSNTTPSSTVKSNQARMPYQNVQTPGNRAIPAKPRTEIKDKKDEQEVNDPDHHLKWNGMDPNFVVWFIIIILIIIILILILWMCKTKYKSKSKKTRESTNNSNMLHAESNLLRQSGPENIYIEPNEGAVEYSNNITDLYAKPIPKSQRTNPMTATEDYSEIVDNSAYSSEDIYAVPKYANAITNNNIKTDNNEYSYAYAHLANIRALAANFDDTNNVNHEYAAIAEKGEHKYINILNKQSVSYSNSDASETNMVRDHTTSNNLSKTNSNHQKSLENYYINTENSNLYANTIELK